ncbi:uncharacterized protein LOC143242900 isoform X3 [Tachypleus tridentatus]|uniref:uncharacterized protein LOC143242900 isoform X3 n=1 Tax=Tachypleus tridentatus TaxID=6853 RepID=UPI003FCF4CDB
MKVIYHSVRHISQKTLSNAIACLVISRYPCTKDKLKNTTLSRYFGCIIYRLVLERTKPTIDKRYRAHDRQNFRRLSCESGFSRGTPVSPPPFTSKSSGIGFLDPSLGNLFARPRIGPFDLI